VVEEVVHRSEMSVVYRAREVGGPPVAIKHFSALRLPATERAEALHWLAREAGLLSVLYDSHLPELLVAFSDGDDHYIVMPYLEGQTIKELVAAHGPLSEGDAVQHARALAETLCYLHSEEPPVIHRDLKPDNILVQPNGHLILLDLGVARPLARGAIGTAIGTPGYAAPEQYQGIADERSDLYGLGAVLHYMLTGYDAEHQAPFRHPSVGSLRPEITVPLQDLVSALLQIGPERRPQRADDVTAYLANISELQVCSIARDLYLASGRRYVKVVGCLMATWLGGAVAMGLTFPIRTASTAQMLLAVVPLLLALLYVTGCHIREGYFSINRASAAQQARQRIKQPVERYQRRALLLVLVLGIGVIPFSWVLSSLAMLFYYPLAMRRSARAMSAHLEQQREALVSVSSLSSYMLPASR
jgi:hypothetical protein